MTKPLSLFLMVGLASFSVYFHTLAPTITWRNDGVDSGDLATAVAVGGVPHPPGYPTYLLLGELFKRVPFGDIAYRLNLLSATCAALSAALLGLVIYRTLSVTPGDEAGSAQARRAQRLRWVCAVSAALTLAFANTFWSQAVIAEVYALNALLAAILLYGSLQLRPANEKWLGPGLAGLLGLSLGNHPSIVLLLPLLIGGLKARWRWRLIVAAGLAFCVGLSIYLILPLRAATSPPVNWGAVTTWPNFVWLVSAAPYRQFLFTLPWSYTLTRMAAELRLLTEGFAWWGLPVALLGLQRLVALNRSLAWRSLVSFLLISIYAIGYNTTDSYVYLLPAFLIVALWIGWGLYHLSKMLLRLVRSIPPARHLVNWGLLLLPALSLFLNFSNQNISQDDEAYRYAQQTLNLTPPGAVIITNDDPRTFALWYGRYGLALHPDVAIVNSNLLPYAWYRHTLQQTHARLLLSDQAGRPFTTLSTFIEGNFSNSPIYLATVHSPRLTGYRLKPVDSLQLVTRLTDD